MSYSEAFEQLSNENKKFLGFDTDRPQENLGKPKGRTLKKLKTVAMSDVRAEPVHWLWEPYVPIGKLTLLEGDPEVGKTWLALGIAAMVSTGFQGKDSPAPVLFCTAEDGLADTLRPRLDAAGADSKLIHAIEGVENGTENLELFSFDNLELLGETMTEIRPRLVVVDPLQAFMGAGVDAHKAHEVRPVLSRLKMLAERHNCAVIAIRHLNKMAGSKSIYRGMGSIDFFAAARSVLLVGKNPKDPNERVMIHHKSSLVERGPSLSYRIENGRFEWAGESTLGENDLLGGGAVAKNNNFAIDEWLIEVLAGAPVLAGEIKERAAKRGFTERQLNEAKKRLRVSSSRYGNDKNPPWVWKLPDETDDDERLDDFTNTCKDVNTTQNGTGSGFHVLTPCKDVCKDVEGKLGAGSGDFFGRLYDFTTSVNT